MHRLGHHSKSFQLPSDNVKNVQSVAFICVPNSPLVEDSTSSSR